MDIEDSILSNIKSERAPVHLREVYLKERCEEHLEDASGDEKICQLCMQVVTCEFTSIEAINVDTLLAYIPKDVSRLLDFRDPFLLKLFNIQSFIKK